MKTILFIVIFILLYFAFGYATAMTICAMDESDMNDQKLGDIIVIVIGWPIAFVIGLCIFIFKCIIKPFGKMLSVIPITIVAFIKSKED